MKLLDALFRCEEVEDLLAERACLQGMLDFEAALARAEAAEGVIPSSAAAAIAACCKAELFDAATIGAGAKLAGNLAIPLVKELTHQVAQSDKEAARYVHWGATSQDAIDTGRVLQIRRALKFFAGDLQKLSDALADLATKHKATIVAGRAGVQQAAPPTLWAVVAGWWEAGGRGRARLHKSGERGLWPQIRGGGGRC